MITTKLEMAIVGFGFVGSAVDYGFPDDRCNKLLIDPKLGTSIENLKTTDVDITFICVPTPMGNDARIDASILIDSVTKAIEYTKGLVVIKSTVIPSIIDKITSLSNRIIYNPEFLREKEAKSDFVYPPMHVFGGDREHTDWLHTIYDQYSICHPCIVYHMTPVEASFVKYGINSFLMSKVLWFNQFSDIVEKTSANYDTVIEVMKTDPRIGNSHMNVPGHDGRKGSAGACFAKDGPAFAMFARDMGTDFTILEEVLRKNQVIRNSYGEPLPREKEQHIRFDYDI